MKSLKRKSFSPWIPIVAAAAVVASGALVAVGAQDRPPDNSPLVLPGHTYGLPGMLLTRADMMGHLERMKAVDDDDIPMNMLNAGGVNGRQLGVSVVYREEGGPRPSYAIHDDVGEVYVMLQGSGRIDVGGTLVDAARRPFSPGNGRGQRGTRAEGSRTFSLNEGDIFFIPAGSPHRWMGADAFTAYAVVRVDPEGVAPLLEFGSPEYEAQFEEAAAGGGQRPADTSPLALPNHTYGGPGVLTTRAEMMEHLERMKAVDDDDIPMWMRSAGGVIGGQLGVSVVYREEGGPRPAYAIHDDVGEVYVMLQGSGRIDVGGTLVDAARRLFSRGNGRGQRGTRAEGSRTFSLNEGDIFFIPAGSPHRWMGADAFTAYAVIRADPEGVAPLLELGSPEYEAQFKE